jgi:ribonuclease Z
MKLGVLGSAGALSSARRANTSLVLAARSSMLVDCSGNAAQALARLGIDWPALDHVLLTHRHVDHLSGLPSLVDHISLATRATGRGPLTVWGPESALEIGCELLHTTRVLGRSDLFELRFVVLEPRERTLELGDLQVTVFPVDHGEVPTLGLRAAPAGRPESAVVCSSDTSPCRAVLEHARGSRLLVHECSSFDVATLPAHSTLAELEQSLSEIGPPETLLVHLPPVPLDAEQAAAARLEARFGKRVKLAEDGELREL